MAYEKQIDKASDKDLTAFKLCKPTAQEEKEAALLDVKDYFFHTKQAPLKTKFIVMKLKQLCPAIVLLRSRSLYSDDDDKGKALWIIDFDRENKFYIRLFKNSKSNSLQVEVGNDWEDSKDIVTLYSSSEYYEELLKIKPLTREFKPMRFRITKEWVEQHRNGQIYMRIGEVFDKIEWGPTGRVAVNWQKTSTPDAGGVDGPWFGGLEFPFYDEKSGLYYRYEGSEHCLGLMVRIKAVVPN